MRQYLNPNPSIVSGVFLRCARLVFIVCAFVYQLQSTWSSQTNMPLRNAVVPYTRVMEIDIGDEHHQAVQFLPPSMPSALSHDIQLSIHRSLRIRYRNVIRGLNLGQSYLTAAYLNAKSIVKAFTSTAVKDTGITLDGIEIGNEADLYSNT